MPFAFVLDTRPQHAGGSLLEIINALADGVRGWWSFVKPLQDPDIQDIVLLVAPPWKPIVKLGFWNLLSFMASQGLPHSSPFILPRELGRDKRLK